MLKSSVAVQCGALWELLSYIQMRPSVFSRSRGHQIQKNPLHFDYINDPLSIKINVEMGEMLL